MTESPESRSPMASAPIGLRLALLIFRKCCPPLTPAKRLAYYRAFILISTFLAYTCYHMIRRPLSVVKSVLHQDCRFAAPDPTVVVTVNNSRTWCNWAPFDGDDSPELFSYLDSIYLFTYAACMFVSGFVAERTHLRYFLGLGMLLSALTTHIFGLGESLGVHSFAFYFVVQLFGGAFQSTGWPSVVACVGNWFGKKKRGLIFGIWNAHTSVGNILGANIAGLFVNYNWGLSFVVPSAICGLVGLFVVLFLVPYPDEVGCESPAQNSASLQTSLSSAVVRPDDLPDDEDSGLFDEEEERCLLEKQLKKESEKKAVTFGQALCIPGVVDFSAALFFAKLVSYTFLFWLPFYIHASTKFDSAGSAYASTAFDFGGIVGGILAGYLSDRTGVSAITCIVFLVTAVPMMFVYESFGSINLLTNLALQSIAGLLINGPYALITTAVSAELGTHPTVSGSSKALATVTAIIDGTGSVGAAVGPLLAGLILQYGWNTVFYMVMASDVLAVLCLLRVAKREWMRLRARKTSDVSVN